MRIEEEPLIFFKDEDANDNVQDNTLSILIWISIAQVKRLMVDTESTIDVLFIDTF